ncbi:MAG: hypothetical protein WA621_11750 [Candidatus Acidiferrum sp.]|jgi:uncharacterized membrane protein
MQIPDVPYLQMAHAHSAAALLIFAIPGIVFWTYFAGTAILVIGLSFLLRNGASQSRGLDKLTLFGPLFFAIPLAVFAAEHFTVPGSIAQAVPPWMPAHRFWVYLVGTALVAGALSIVVKWQAQLAATLLGIMFGLFVMMIHIPNVVANPRNRILWAVALRDLSFSGGAFAFAGAFSKQQPAKGLPGFVHLGRFFVAIPALFFGVEHFLHPDFVPGVPLGKVVPTWIPGRIFWDYLTGAILLGAGVSILIRKNARLAAAILGGIIFLVVLFVYLPMVIAAPSDIGGALNYFADTLMYSGAVLLLAGALPKEEHPQA